jgi:hypothetical protein
LAARPYQQSLLGPLEEIESPSLLNLATQNSQRCFVCPHTIPQQKPEKIFASAKAPTTLTTSAISILNRTLPYYRQSNLSIIDTLTEWLTLKKFHAVIWSDFAPNFVNRQNTRLTAENICTYIMGLSPEEKENAIAYIRKTPEQIQTKYRPQIEQLLRINQ